MRSFIKKLCVGAMALLLVLGMFGCAEDSVTDDLAFFEYGEGYAVGVNPASAQSLQKVVIPDSYNGKPVVRIAEYGFANCTNLKEIQLPEGIKEIGVAAFSNCTSLGSLSLPNSVNVVEKYAFSNCTSLQCASFGNQVTTLGAYAFSFCDQLTAVQLSESLSALEEYTFYGCRALEYFEVPNSVVSIDEGTFQNCANLYSVKLGSSLTALDLDAFEGCASLAEIHVDFENGTYCSKDGVLYTVTTRELFYVPPVLAGEIEILDGVKSIPTNAFARRNAITSVTIPASVQAIGACVFMDCGNLDTVYFLDQTAVFADDDNNVLPIIDASRVATVMTDTYASKSWKKQVALQ